MALAGGGGTVLVGTVPSTDTWIFKDVRVWNPGAATASVFVFYEDAGATVQAVLINTMLLTLTSIAFSGWAAAAPGDKLIIIYTNGPVQIIASGADLPGHL